MTEKTEIKIKDTAKRIFYNDIKPALSVELDNQDDLIIIEAIRDGLRLAVDQGRKW